MESFSRRRLYFLIASGLAVACMVLVLELAFFVMSRFPAAGRAPLLRDTARSLYVGDRDVIQFLPEAARWDPKLGYTLVPGRFTFSNIEFENTFLVNRLGVRDDEGSLAAPQVVVLGDSMAMGWGVNQDETFAQVIERESGIRVLNTAISSYGTARELQMLSRVDLSQTRTLVFQYCENDDTENAAFERNGNQLETMTAEEYEALVESARRGKHYYPLKYLWRGVFKKLRWRLFPPPDGPGLDSSHPDDREREVELFLNTLRRSPVDLSPFQIVVFELNSWDHDSDWFIPLLAQRVQDPDLPAFLQRLRAVPLADELTAEDFYDLDDHIRASGHHKIAARLLDILRSLDGS